MKKENTAQILESVDADTLLSTPLVPRKFLVEGLIPQGLTVLSGASKAGKSWMVLWMALKIAAGETVWNLKTRQCKVLYLSLEDTMERLQERIYQLTDKASTELRLSVSVGRIGKGLEEQICHHMSKYPDTGLIIIDTLQKVRDTKSSNNIGMYASDYDDVGVLKKLTDRLNVAMIVVHHLRKMKDESDPFNEITGSTGIMGAADSALLLKRERGSDSAKLLATGRDIEYQELELKLDSEKFIWKLQKHKNAAKIKEESIPPFVHNVAQFIKNERYWTGSAKELLEAVGEKELNNYQVTRTLARHAHEAFEPLGIRYETGRTSEGRYIVLMYEPPAEGIDRAALRLIGEAGE